MCRAQTQVLPSLVPAVPHLRELADDSGGSSAGTRRDPLRAALPDMKLGPRALTCNHFMHYKCHLTYLCVVLGRRQSALLPSVRCFLHSRLLQL